MGAQGGKKLRQHRIIALCDQAEKEQQFGADAASRTEPPDGGTQVHGVAAPMEQESELIVACDGLLTRVVGVCRGLTTLRQRSLACGVGARVHGFVLRGNSRIGFALQGAAPVKEVAKLRQSITPPWRVLARRVRARHEAPAPIGGHADAVDVGLAEGVNRGFPGLGCALRGQGPFQPGRAVRLKRDQEGLMAGKTRIAELKPPWVRCHREGRRQSRTVVLEACTEMPHGIGLGVEVL